MHALDLRAMRLVLSFLFFFFPSGLDDVSHPIQDLAFSPYVVGEVQRGVIYGTTYCASVPQITTVPRALFPAGGLGPAVEDVLVPEAQPEHQHPYKLPYATSQPLQGTPLAIFPLSTSVDILETVPKPPVQPTCSSFHVDAPVIANVSRIFQDLTAPGDPSRHLLSVSWSVLADTAGFILTFVLLLLCWTTILSVLDVYSRNVLVPLDMHIRMDLMTPGGQTNTNIPKPNLRANVQPDRIMADVGIQTNSASSPSILKLDNGVQTDADLELISYSPSPTGNLVLNPAMPAIVDGGIQMDMTGVNPICVLPLSVSVNYEVKTDGLKEVVSGNETQTKSPTEAELLCGLALTMPQVDGTDKLALGTAVIDIPTRSTPVAAINPGSCTKELVSTFTKVSSIKDEILTDVNDEPTPACALSLSLPTDVERSTSSSILRPLPRNVTLHLTSQDTSAVMVPEESAARAIVQLKEKFKESKVDEGKQIANAPALVPSPNLRLATLPNPEDSVIPVVLVKPVSVSTPTRPLGTVTQAPSHFVYQHPPPFRPPGLGYQPSPQVTAGPGLCVQQGPLLTPPAPRSTVDKRPIRSRFPGMTTQLQQLITPPPDHPTGLKNHAIPIGPPSSPGLNHVAHPFPQQAAPVAIPAHPTVRPFMLPTKDFNVPDPFSRSLTSSPLVPVDSDLNSRSEPRSAALRFIPRCVIPVPAASPVSATRQVLRRFRPLPIPVPVPVVEPAAPPPPPTPVLPVNVHPLLKKAPPFWAPPRENSALPVVAPPKKPRVRTRVRSRRVGRDEFVDIEIDEDEGKDDHVGVAIATAVLDGVNDCARFPFHFEP